MKSFARARSFAALLVMLSLLLTPLTALAKKGEKNYNRGIEYETALQWEKAAQEFALAVAASPSDIEYQLHYNRAIFMASQVFMQRGRALAEQGNYTAAYNAFRQAYGYDPVNQLAASEMERMLRYQREKEGLITPARDIRRDGTGPTPPPRGAMNTVRPLGATALPQEQLPERSQQLRVINYNGELEPLIRKLAEELNLNIVFDRDFAQQVGKRQVTYNLREVTTARALDYIFTAQGLFFQKMDRRTILVADQSKRPQYQQLVLRTFYLYNIKPEDARTLIQQALPANAGRQPAVMLNKETNSITVRDTPENIRLLAELLPSIDKDRAEVVMDVSIYEVSRSDLLQIGNQIGTEGTLAQLGGTGPGIISIGNRAAVTNTLGISPPTALGAAILLPASTISAFQSKDNTRLVFSTQVHAFDDEKSETRIGQKVPVQTASVTPFGFNAGGNTGGGTGTNPGVFNGGFPVIQYEDTGLSLDFTPKVYPNHDVQVKMVIDTKDAVFSGSADRLVPTFTQRRITGTARIPNNRTIMIASIAQDRQSNGRQGLPLIGLIPILGRLFSTPRRDNRESDVVITMTPRVLRAPSITPRDEEMRNTGSIQSPQSESLEALVRDADREDQLAAARRLPTNTTVQLPPATETASGATETASVTPSTAAAATTTTTTTAATTTTTAANEQVTYVPAPNALVDPTKAVAETTNAGTPAPQPVNAAVSLDVGTGAPPTPTTTDASLVADKSPPLMPISANAVPSENRNDAGTAAAAAIVGIVPSAISSAQLRLMSEVGEMRAGQKQRLQLMLKTDAPLGLIAATLRFDPRVVRVLSVTKGAMFDAQSAAGVPSITQSIDPKGVLVVSVAPAAGASALTGEGILLTFEIEAIAAGESAFGFDAGQVHLIAADGRTVLAQATVAQVKVTQQMRSRRQRRRDAETRRHGDAETKEHSSHRSAATSSHLLSPRLRVSASPRLSDPASPRRSSGGWTLIELVVTVTVLAILTLGIVPLIKTSVKRQREQQLRETLRGMREAIKEFHRDTVGIQCAGATTGGVGGEAGQPGRPGAPPPYIDPRSKVVISDCNALNTTENPDLYPPSLELMVEGINVLPRATIAGAVGIGSVDTSRGQATDNKLLSTRKKHYLRAIPVDPITGKAEWDLHSVYDAPDSSEWGGENVFDVRSKSKGTALDGSKYNEW